MDGGLGEALACATRALLQAVRITVKAGIKTWKGCRGCTGEEVRERKDRWNVS